MNIPQSSTIDAPDSVSFLTIALLLIVGAMQLGTAVGYSGTIQTTTGALVTGVSTARNPTSTSLYIVQPYNATTTTTSTPNTTMTTVTTSSILTARPDFFLSAWPSTVWLPPNDFIGSTNFVLTVTSVGGWNGQIQFTTSASPQGITISNLPPPTYLLNSRSAAWSVQVTIDASAKTGSYPLVISGLSGSITHSTVVTINVSNPNPVAEFPQSALSLLAACLVSVAAVGRKRTIRN